MAKIKKVVFILIIILALLYFATQTNYASTIEDAIKGISTAGEEIDLDNGVYTVAHTIIDWLWWISIVLAIISLMIIGLKYITGGVSEKTISKKSLIILAVGSLLVVFATSIVKVLFGVF